MTSPAPVQKFPCHRGVQPLLWAFAVLAVLELLVVHLVVSLKWPRLAWPLSGITLVSLVWLVRWIGSWRYCPYELRDNALRLRFGNLRSVRLPLDTIARIEPVRDARQLKERGVVKLVPLAFPTRIVRLAAPLQPGGRAIAIAIRPDDPAGFDAALVRAGVMVEGHANGIPTRREIV